MCIEMPSSILGYVGLIAAVVVIGYATLSVIMLWVLNKSFTSSASWWHK